MTRRTAYPALAAWLVAASLAPQASASGFQLREQSPSAQGTSFAGVSAGGADIGSMFFNPAAMTQFQGSQAILGFSYVMPKAELENATASSALGTPLGSQSSVPNAAQNALLPNLYAMWSVNPDLKLGLSINAPFGMVTDYDADFAGRYHALKSDLKVVDFAPNVAYRINPRWSVGAAFVARKVEAELTNAVNLSALGRPDGVAKLKGQEWDYGYRLGLVFQPSEALRFGMSYHSAMDVKLDGRATFQLPTLPIPTPASLQDTDASAMLNLPEMISLGIDVQATPALSIQGEISRTGWSSFKELRVDFATAGVSDSVTEEKWHDTWFYSIGLTWKAAEAWTLRTGLAYDQGAVDDAYRTPRIPDGNRTWFSLGAGYAFSRKTSIDFAYTHIFVLDGPLALTAAAPNQTRGNLSGTYKNSIDIFSAQAKFQF